MVQCRVSQFVRVDEDRVVNGKQPPVNTLPSERSSLTTIVDKIADASSSVGKGPVLPSPSIPEDALREFEHKLEADLQTVGVTLVAILGVITFWRGAWSLLDHFIGDSVFGDICCTIVGLTIVLWIRLSGLRIASFWPPS